LSRGLVSCVSVARVFKLSAIGSALFGVGLVSVGLGLVILISFRQVRFGLLALHRTGVARFTRFLTWVCHGRGYGHDHDHSVSCRLLCARGLDVVVAESVSVGAT